MERVRPETPDGAGSNEARMQESSCKRWPRSAIHAFRGVVREPRQRFRPDDAGRWNETAPPGDLKP
jgi:hypothetical protein